MQQCLKSPPRAARTQVIAAELFAQLDVAVDDAPASFDMSLRRERLPPLTRGVESRGDRRNRGACAWDASNVAGEIKPASTQARGAIISNIPQLQAGRTGHHAQIAPGHGRASCE